MFWVVLLKLRSVFLFVANQGASKPIPARSSEDIEFERRKAMRRNLGQSTSSHSYGSSYSRMGSKLLIEGSHNKQGYSRAEEIFRNVEAMRAKERAKELAAKEKEAASKGR